MTIEHCCVTPLTYILQLIILLISFQLHRFQSSNHWYPSMQMILPQLRQFQKRFLLQELPSSRFQFFRLFHLPNYLWKLPIQGRIIRRLLIWVSTAICWAVNTLRWLITMFIKVILVIELVEEGPNCVGWLLLICTFKSPFSFVSGFAFKLVVINELINYPLLVWLIIHLVLHLLKCRNPEWLLIFLNCCLL